MQNVPGFDTFNAKRLTAGEIANSFVMPPSFASIAGGDHCYVIGPRGSGKTTLLRMLTGESLMAWSGSESEVFREQIDYASVFLPADELWASQVTRTNARAAFTAQMLYALVDTMMYRAKAHRVQRASTHLPVLLTHDEEVALARQCASAWGLTESNPSFLGLQAALDLIIARLAGGESFETHPIASADSFALLTIGIRAFNRLTGERDRRWALLLDEMELAPGEIHALVTRFVRGGAGDLILKISMSPFDRYMHYYGSSGSPVPGHDFQTVYLSGQDRRDIYSFTSGLWRESLRSRGIPWVSMPRALGTSFLSRDPRARRTTEEEMKRVIVEAQRQDAAFSRWLRDRHIDVNALETLSYNQRSATVRKVFPLLVFRNSVLDFRHGHPVRRSRKKHLEPFTGADAVMTMLEGNPRWIKTAFAQMLNYFDESTQTVGPGFQYDALVSLANRFEALLRVLPSKQTAAPAIPVVDLVDAIAVHLHAQNSSEFTADPQNGFTVDRAVGQSAIDSLIMGLYAGAFVHVRDRRSPAVLSDFHGQRFRLAYLLAIRDRKEFPLRLGKDVSLSRIVKQMERRRPTAHPDSVPLELEIE
ncbi:hypothetical protein AVP42_00784 [Agromyces sp. NDB4Y10]|nr:hypothetical protein AVP42_00784 [Agromyces sp. NDB4Y10]